MGILNWLGGIVVKIGLDKLIELVKLAYQAIKEKAEVKKKVEAVKDAKTAEEQEQAHDSLVIGTKPKP